MQYYFEINDIALNRCMPGVEGKYLTTQGNTKAKFYNLCSYADRVWMDNNGYIRFVKNRFKVPKDLSSDEMKEFVWIKLRCKHV